MKRRRRGRSAMVGKGGVGWLEEEDEVDEEWEGQRKRSRSRGGVG